MGKINIAVRQMIEKITVTMEVETREFFQGFGSEAGKSESHGLCYHYSCVFLVKKLSGSSGKQLC